MPLCENKHPSIVFEERNVNCPLCVLQFELTASKEDNKKLVEGLKRLKNLHKDIRVKGFIEKLLNSAGKPTGVMKTDAFGNPHEHPLHLNESKTHYICNECGFKIMAKRFRKPTGGNDEHN